METKVFNEYRYSDLLSLWPTREEEEEPATESSNVSLSSPTPGVEGGWEEEASWAGRSTVRDVLRFHLAAFERGYLTLRDAHRAVVRFEDGRWRFTSGDVVEWRGSDLRWRLGMVVEGRGVNVHTVFSPAGLHMTFGDSHADAPLPRPSNKLLRVLFGSTPWRWQQHALLLAEREMVHRRCSPVDFQNVEWAVWAEERWEAWIAAAAPPSKHGIFGELYRSQPPGARRALAALILEPFKLIDEINETWDVVPEELSPYTYLACLGSGVFMVLVCLAIQLGAAFCLWRFHLVVDAEDDRKEWADSEELLPCKPYGDRGPWLGRLMICIVALYYLTKVVPDTFSAAMKRIAFKHARFSSLGGGGGGGGSAVRGRDRIGALRREIRASDKDTLKMILGMRLDEIMNTAFDSLLYLLNLYLLYGSNSVLDILLNCVAVEWIRGIDESFCAAPWWDPNSRYIKAAAVEMVLRKFLDIRSLEARYREKKEGRKIIKETLVEISSSDDDDSSFVATKLQSELQRFYGDDLRKDNSTLFVPVKGCNSWMFGRYKLRVFGRWEKFLDGTIDWEREVSDFDAETHSAAVRRSFFSLRLVYGDVPGFPNAFLKPNARYKLASFLHKYPALANIITTTLGLKIYRAIRYQNPLSGFKNDLPHSPSERRLRTLANLLDALAEFASLWVVVAFPCVIFGSIFFFPFCY